MNKSGLVPVDFKVLLEQHKTEEITEGGIVLSLDTVEKEQWKVSRCDVIAIGGRAFTNLDGVTWPGEIPQVGDTVITREYCGFTISGEDGEKYQLCNDKDILAIVEKSNE